MDEDEVLVNSYKFFLAFWSSNIQIYSNSMILLPYS